MSDWDNWRRHVRLASIALIALAATACGGGGGGGGAPAASGGGATSGGVGQGGGGQGGTPPTTPSTPVSFDAGRAVIAGRTLMSSLEEVSVVAALTDFVVVELARNGRAVDLNCIQLDGTKVPIAFVLTDNNSDGAASPGDVIDFDIAACDGFRYDVTVTLPAGTPWTNRYDARIRFVDTFPGGAVLTGSFDLQAPFLTTIAPAIVVNSLIVTYEQGGQTDRITGAAGMVFDAHDAFDIQFAGNVVSDHLNGTYSFSTIEALGGLNGWLPRAGLIRLVGKNSAVQFRVTHDSERIGFLDLEVDSNGDGVFDPAGIVNWTELIFGTLFGWQPHEPPRITSLTFEPAIPGGNDELIVRYTAEDPEGDNVFFRFEWRINGVLLFGGGTDSDLEVLDPRHYARGDTISFRLIASDGDYPAEQTITTTVANSLPRISGLRITPAMPRATDYLIVSFTTADPDGEALTTGIRWYVNGQLIPTQLGPVLPPAVYSRDDVVRVVVSAADAESVVMAEATTTILDTPPQISFLSPPVGEIGFDEGFTAATRITDADDDPVDDIAFRIAYGPSGMSVDPATGVVHWLDKGPMFLERMSFNYGITLDVPGANVLAGTVDVVDAERERALFRTTYAFEAPDEDDLLALDLDGDGADEMLLVRKGLLYEIEHSNGSFRRSWQFPGLDRSGLGLRTIAAADIDGDGQAELFANSYDGIAVLGGAQRALVDEVLLGEDWYDSFPVTKLADLDLDGRLEIVSAALTRLRILDAATLATIHDFPEGLYGWGMAIGNVDADGPLELVFSSGWVIDGRTFIRERDFGMGGERNVAVGDLDGDGVDEIAIADRNPAVIRGFSALSGNEIWTIPVAGAGSLHMDDIGGGPESELIVGDGAVANGFLSVYRDEGGPTPVLVAQTAAYTDNGIVAIATGDVDNDGEVEVIFAEDGPPQTITVASGDLAAIEWTTASLTTPRFRTMSRGARMAGTDVDSPKLINIVNFPTGLRLLGMDADTGAIDYTAVLGDPTSESLAIAVTDYDNDLRDEVLVLVTEDLQTTIMAVDYFSGAVEWESPPLPRGGPPDLIAAGDLTGDGWDDVVAIHSNTAYAFDIRFSQQIWTAPIAFSPDHALEVADVNGTGNAEIVLSSGRSITVYSGDDGPIGPVATGAFIARDIAVGDVDGDGEPEIFAVISRAGSLNDAIYRLNGELGVQSVGQLTRRATDIVIEKSDHGRVNLLVWEDMRPGLSVVDPDTGSEIWAWPFYFGTVPDRDAVQFVELNGEYRVVMTTTEGVYITQ